MTAVWEQIDDESASHGPPPEPVPDKPGRPTWLPTMLIITALLLIAAVMLFVVPNALGASPGGGCGGG
jgi:hypothetical protein